MWPYVNGKALMSGIRLGNLEASDMLDVIHYLFEESINYSTAEQAKASEQVRSKLYTDIYQREYKYSSSDSNRGFSASGDFDFDPEDEAEEKEASTPVSPFNPRYKEPTKAFVPATNFGSDEDDPFSGILDAPIG